MERHDLDAVCPACNQPKGHGYGCAAPPEGAAAPPGGSLRQCVMCGDERGVHLATSPVCPDHASPVAFVQALQEARSERDVARDLLVKLTEVLNEAGGWCNHGVLMDRPYHPRCSNCVLNQARSVLLAATP